MKSDTESNPCCLKKGTLVITIEPCTKGQETQSERHFFGGERYIPGMPQRTPRTMEIEVKIKAKDQVLFSDGEKSPAPKPPAAIEENHSEEIELKTYSPSPSAKEVVEKKEHNYEEDEENFEDETSIVKEDSSEVSMKSVEESSKPRIFCSSRTIQLERKPCSEICPGPLICLQKNSHFFGDRCKLHDPTAIGKQILAMHKNGLIRKHLYVSDAIYPEHILNAVSEITRRQASRIVEGKQDSVPESKGDVVAEVVQGKTTTPFEEARKTKEIEETIIESKVKNTLSLGVKDEGPKKNRSGCYC